MPRKIKLPTNTICIQCNKIINDIPFVKLPTKRGQVKQFTHLVKCFHKYVKN